jgi:hypothetical protein
VLFARIVPPYSGRSTAKGHVGSDFCGVVARLLKQIRPSDVAQVLLGATVVSPCPGSSTKYREGFHESPRASGTRLTRVPPRFWCDRPVRM